MATAAARADDAAPSAPCPRGTAGVLERFIDADCTTCWTDGAVSRPAADEWLLDWIVPTASGDDAPLAAAAPPDASARARRALGKTVEGGFTTPHRTAASSGGSLQLRVRSGPAWNGYIAVQVDASGRVPVGATAWIALVESVAAGTSGSVVPRQLVRSVSGPLTPDALRSGRPWQYLQAMRWPDTAKPARLQARAWIENSGGRIVAMAGERCAPR